ncbi:MAG: PspC domain-containing protein [Coriobacteriia bacterium]|jgi:phage shock protein PspC (stress-responsive transcriptional regulator)|nr:PspC domain-containing protein [Coriobacteriia bacterium]
MSTGAPGGRNDNNLQAVYIVIGVALIVAGLALLGALPFFGWAGAPWNVLRDIISAFRRFGWPLAVIAFGVLVIVYSMRPGAKLPGKDARLTRSREKKVIAGVLGGLSDYFSVDVSVVRLGYVLLAFLLDAWGPLVVAYVAAAIIVPQAPEPGTSTLAGTPSGPPPAPASPSTEGGRPSVAQPSDAEGDNLE